MINLLYGLAAILTLGISILGIAYLVYFGFKSGFRIVPIVVAFLVICMGTYLIQNPAEIPKIGGILVNGIADILSGKA